MITTGMPSICCRISCVYLVPKDLKKNTWLTAEDISYLENKLEQTLLTSVVEFLKKAMLCFYNI